MVLNPLDIDIGMAVKSFNKVGELEATKLYYSNRGKSKKEANFNIIIRTYRQTFLVKINRTTVLSTCKNTKKRRDKPVFTLACFP